MSVQHIAAARDDRFNSFQGSIDLMQAFSVQPAPLDFVLPGMLAGTVGGITSPGGTGKSMLAIELAILIGSGVDLSGFGGGQPLNRGKVLFMAAEDPALAIQHRIFAIGQHLTLDQRELVAENVSILSLVGTNPDLMIGEWRDEFHRQSDGKRLVIFDTLRRFHKLDENSSGDMATVLGVLESSAKANGHASVFLHHTSKSAATNGLSDTPQASRGSGVLVDNGRWQMFLAGATLAEAKTLEIDEVMRPHFIRVGVAKQNYGPPVADVWMQRGKDGVLVPANFSTQKVTDRRFKSTQARVNSTEKKDW